MGFLIGQGIGRWGNFFNHECFGSNTTLPWGMTSLRINAALTAKASEIYASTGVTVDPAQPVHPCFLYESLWCLLGFLLLHLYFKHRKFDGEIFFMYVGWYGLGRFFIEGLRTDSLMIGYVRVSQLVAAISVVTALAVIISMRVKIKHDGEYTFYKDTEESKALLAETEVKYEEAEKRRAEKKEQKAARKTNTLAEKDKLVDDADKDDSDALKEEASGESDSNNSNNNDDNSDDSQKEDTENGENN
jgi:phosphatidylglycerol:prolipoprotein diacylglycerol transferase